LSKDAQRNKQNGIDSKTTQKKLAYTVRRDIPHGMATQATWPERAYRYHTKDQAEGFKAVLGLFKPFRTPGGYKGRV